MMDIIVRKLYTELVDFDKLRDDIHNEYGKTIRDTVARESPVETGNLQASWYYERVNQDRTEISNDAPHILYLLGTGIWSERAHVIKRSPYQWRADDYNMHVCPYVRGINPHRIAIKINRSGLRCPRSADEVSLGESHKIDSYDFPYNIQRYGIFAGEQLAIKRLRDRWS